MGIQVANFRNVLRNFGTVLWGALPLLALAVAAELELWCEGLGVWCDSHNSVPGSGCIYAACTENSFFNFSTIPWKMKSRNVPQRSLFATYQSFAANFTVDNAGAANAVNLLP